MSRIRLTVLAAASAVAIAGGAFYLGRVTSHSDTATASAPASAASVERKVLYWHDPMVPTQKFDKPGKSPFMDMPLVPVYADEADDSGVKVSPRVQQNLGIRTAVVKRVDVNSSFDTVGTVQFDEDTDWKLRSTTPQDAG